MASDFDAFDGSGDLDDVVKIVVRVSLAVDDVGIHFSHNFRRNTIIIRHIRNRLLQPLNRHMRQILHQIMIHIRQIHLISTNHQPLHLLNLQNRTLKLMLQHFQRTGHRIHLLGVVLKPPLLNLIRVPS